MPQFSWIIVQQWPKQINIVFPSTKHFFLPLAHLSKCCYAWFLADFKKVVYLKKLVPYFEKE
jgi:hypothetical protein